MSAHAMSLKSKPVVAVVLVLLAIVIAANVATFKPGQKRPRRPEVRVQASQPMPIDLASLRLDSTIPAENLAAWTKSETPVLQRDPFGNRPVRRSTEPHVESLTTEAPGVAWQCNAIFLSGRKPAAMINGKSYRVGEQIDDQTVVAIGTSGVKLRAADGVNTFLPVLAERDFVGQARIVNENSNHNSRGNTHLVEHSRSGRK